MATLNEAHKLLSTALQQHTDAQIEAEIKEAVLMLHAGLDAAFRAYLAGNGYGEVSHQDVNFPALLELLENNTTLFADDPDVARLLNSLNKTRNAVAHPTSVGLQVADIARDARQMARLARRFWPALFGEPAPPAHVTPSRQTPPPRPREEPARPQPTRQSSVPQVIDLSPRPVRATVIPVSYTHLTLPTKRIV